MVHRDMAVARRGLMLVFALAALALACGGTTSGEDGGADGAPDGTVKDVFVEGPAPCVTSTYAVDASACVPQLAMATTCLGQACDWQVEVPCSGDAGATDAGDAGDASDAATIDCAALCNAARPQNASGQGCAVYTQGLVTHVLCGNCGFDE
jgi:hypothetical protein